MAEQLAQLAVRAKFHPDEPTRCVTVDAIVASHAALAEQLALVRTNLAAALDELRQERAARQAAETERDRLRSALATMMAQADAEAGRHEGQLAAYRMLLRDAERAAGQSGDVDHGSGAPKH